MQSKFIDGSDATDYQGSISELIEQAAGWCEEVREGDEPAPHPLRGRMSQTSARSPFSGIRNVTTTFQSQQDAIEFYERETLRAMPGMFTAGVQRAEDGRYVVFQTFEAGVKLPFVGSDGEVVTMIDSDRYICEASELCLPPGVWPAAIATNVGNKRDFVLMRTYSSAAVYEQLCSTNRLMVFAD